MLFDDNSRDADPYLPMQAGALVRRLHAAIAELGDRYGAVLPREAVGEIVQAAARIVLRQGSTDPDSEAVAEQIVARAKGDLAMAVGAPVGDGVRPSASGLATAWTHLLDGVAVVRAVGEFDLNTHLILRQELTQAVASGRLAILVDLGRVSFMDHAGLAPLIVAAHAARRSGQRLVLLQVPAPVRRIIEVSGVAGEFDGAAVTRAGGRAATGGRAG
jgi:anti-anti-sigma factor